MKKEFLVPDMTCAHCVKMITTALQELDANATVQADTDTHWLSVDGTNADTEAIMMKLQEAGYSPKPV